MRQTIQLGSIEIEVSQKEIKNIHLSVHPPEGKVTLAAPLESEVENLRLYALTKLTWIKKQRRQIQAQERETPRDYIEQESHYLWGRRYLMRVVFEERKPSISLDHKRITLTVRPGSSHQKRSQVIHAWHKSLLHEAIPPLVQKWERKFGVEVAGYFLQRMKTKWGSCNHHSRNIRLNTELVKKPEELLEYVVAHEVAHLIEPTHNERFVAIIQRHFPTWKEARAELNELPLGSVIW